MFDGQSRHWSWREVWYSIKTIQSIPQNQPWSTSGSRKAPNIYFKNVKCLRRGLCTFLFTYGLSPGWNGHHSPQTWILLKNCETSNMAYKEAKDYIWARCVLPGRMGENSKRKNLNTPSWLQEEFASCYSCPRKRYKVQSDRVPKLLLHRAFFFFNYIETANLTHLEVRFTSVHQNTHYERLFDQGCPHFCIKLYALCMRYSSHKPQDRMRMLLYLYKYGCHNSAQQFQKCGKRHSRWRSDFLNTHFYHSKQKLINYKGFDNTVDTAYDMLNDVHVW